MPKIFDPNQHGPQGVCIHCDNRGTQKQPLRRGLCVLHYGKFQSAMNQKREESEEVAEDYEQLLIAKCLVLPSRQGNKSKSDNPFLNVEDDRFTGDSRVHREFPAALKKVDANSPAATKEKIPEKKPVSTKKGSQK